MQSYKQEYINLENDYLTYKQLAEILHLKVSTLRNWMSLGKFKQGRDYIKLGNAKKARVLFKKDLLKRIDKLFK